MFTDKENIVEVKEDTRIPRDNRKEGMHYYEMRHTGDDWSKPCSVENKVSVNFWGTLVTRKPIALSNEGGIDLSEEDAESLMFMAEESRLKLDRKCRYCNKLSPAEDQERGMFCPIKTGGDETALKCGEFVHYLSLAAAAQE